MGAVATRPRHGEQMAAGPSLVTVKIPGRATAGRLGVVEMEIEAGWSGPPLHVHTELQHVWYVTDGEIDLLLREETLRCEAGACVYVPPGVAHGFSTAETGGATLLEVDTPRALDGYFRELSAAFPPGTPVDGAVVAQIMARHDTTAVR